MTRASSGKATGTSKPERASKSRVRRRRGELSREQIVEAAVHFVDRHAAEELSMRRLAAELGVGTMTLYGYFRDKDELLDAMVGAIRPRRPRPEPSGPWRATLRDLFVWFREYLDDHPAVVRIRFERPIVTPAAFRFTESALAVLEQAGFARQEAVRGFRTLFVHCFGFAAFNPPERAAEGERDVRVAIASLPRDEYPVLTASAEELAAVMEPESQFLYELELILDALEARLERS